MRARLLFVTVLLEIGSRLTPFAAVLALFGASADVAMAAALGVVACAAIAARTWLRARVLHREIGALYDRVLSAVEQKPTTSLVTNREHGQGGAIADAIYDVALVHAVVLPDLIGAAVSLAFVLAVVASRLGPAWLLVGALAALFLVALFAPARRAARRAREKGWAAHMRVAKLFDTLLLGAAELRASGRQRDMARAIAEEARTVSRMEARGMLLGAITATVPALFALLLLAIPRSFLGSVLGPRLGEASVLAAAGVSFGLAAVAGLESLVRGAPVRTTLDRFLAPLPPLSFGGTALVGRGEQPRAEPEAIRVIRFAGVAVRHAGAEIDTPSDLSFHVERGGVALVGPNGVGKSTALLALLGLVDLARGEVAINGTRPAPERWPGLRARMLLLPQRPHVVPDEPIGWHIGLFGTSSIDDRRLVAALDEVGLRARLEGRATARGCAVADLPMGELSGGEQRRVLLCRSLLHDVDVVLFDEPEAGLDQEGRGRVEKLLERLATTCIVVVVAHDESIVPESYQRLDLCKH